MRAVFMKVVLFSTCESDLWFEMTMATLTTGDFWSRLLLPKAIFQHDRTATLSQRLKKQNFSTERCITEPWGVHLKTQVVPTTVSVAKAKRCYLGDINAIIFHVKILDSIKLECTWILNAVIAEMKETFLLRKYRLSRAEDFDGLDTSDYSYLSIEQCPHTFSPSMVEHCEVHVRSKGWMTVQDPSDINILLGKAAQVLHYLSCSNIPTSSCELRRQCFEPVSGLKGECLLASGSLGIVKTLTRTETPPSARQQIEKWIDGIPRWGFEEVEQWASGSPATSYSKGLAPKMKKPDWERVFERALNEDLSKISQEEEDILAHRNELGSNVAPGVLVSEQPADPSVILIGQGHSPEAKLEVNTTVPFSQIAQLWIDCKAMEFVRFVPRSLRLAQSSEYLLNQCQALNCELDKSKLLLDSKLTVFRGNLARPVWEQFDKLLAADMRELENQARSNESKSGEAFAPRSEVKTWAQLVQEPVAIPVKSKRPGTSRKEIIPVAPVQEPVAAPQPPFEEGWTTVCRRKKTQR